MTSEAILKAILSMDAYNRGYDAGIKFGNGEGSAYQAHDFVKLANTKDQWIDVDDMLSKGDLVV